MTNIAVLAEREARAEAQKGKADQAWRKAWWATTLALGAIPKNERKRAGTEQRIVAEATGQTLTWLSKRTAAGRVYVVLAHDVTALPPRMAVAAVDAGVEITADVVKQIVKAEKDGVSLREFREALTGKAWADTPAGVSPETIKQIVAAQPEAVAEAIVESEAGVKAVNEAVARTPIGQGVRQGIKRSVSEHEARESGPKHLRLGIGVTGELLEHAGWLDTIVEEFTPDAEGAEAARLICQVFRYRCDMLEAWAGGNFEPMSQEDFEREMAALMGDPA